MANKVKSHRVFTLSGNMEMQSDWIDRSLCDHPDQGPALTASSNTNAPSVLSFWHHLHAVRALANESLEFRIHIIDFAEQIVFVYDPWKPT